MPRTGLWTRVFAGLVLAVIPPILLLVIVLILSGGLLRDLDPVLVSLTIVASAVAWAAMLAVLFTRGLGDDLRELVSLARHGDDAAAEEPAAGAAYRELADSLEERNRQVATLARQSSLVAIDQDPRAVTTAIVASTRTVMRDATWRCAILVSPQPDLLPAAVYDADAGTDGDEPIGELERWASVTEAILPVRRIEGPWGAFVVVDLPVGPDARGLLYAPWEGRAAPSRAETDLLLLVAQHAGTALEHSLLFAQVASQAEELERLARIQADFLRGVTHDLQTPLTSIGALATELGADATLSSSARADLDSIGHQAGRLRRMVGQLLVASRLEAGAVTPNQEVFAPRPIVERTWSALRDDRPFRLTESGDPHLAVGDPDRFEQVLWAVLDNAVKYSPPGSPIEVRITAGEESIAVAVRDDGAGMDETTHARAFEQFYRAEGARRLAPDGSGIGLYAARGLMEAMGGRIEIDTRLGGGSTVTLTLPAERAEAGSD